MIVKSSPGNKREVKRIIFLAEDTPSQRLDGEQEDHKEWKEFAPSTNKGYTTFWGHLTKEKKCQLVRY